MINRLILRLSEQQKERLKVPFLRIGKGGCCQKAAHKEIEYKEHHLQFREYHSLQNYAQTCESYKDKQVEGVYKFVDLKRSFKLLEHNIHRFTSVPVVCQNAFRLASALRCHCLRQFSSGSCRIILQISLKTSLRKNIIIPWIPFFLIVDFCNFVCYNQIVMSVIHRKLE